MSEDALRRSSIAAKATALLGMLDRNCAFAGLPPLAGASGVAAITRILDFAEHDGAPRGAA